MKKNICKIMILPAAALLLASCGSPRLPLLITAQYADRPVLIGQYKSPGEKIAAATDGVSFESKQGVAVNRLRVDKDFNINKLSRDILMQNPKKNDMIIIQEIKVESSTWDSTAGSYGNESTVKGKVIGN